MSGRHRAVKPRRRVWPSAGAARLARSMTRPFVRPGKKVLGRAWARLVERARERFEREDPWAGVTLDPQATSPDPLPAPAPPEVEEPEPEPVTLTPEQVLPTLQTQHPHLPLVHVLWDVNARGVSGEVNPLEADATGRRRIVEMFSTALAAPVEEDQDDEHLTVYATAEIGGVPFTVAAVIPRADTIPLRVYRESASAQETQALSEEVLREVMA